MNFTLQYSNIDLSCIFLDNSPRNLIHIEDCEQRSQSKTQQDITGNFVYNKCWNISIYNLFLNNMRKHHLGEPLDLQSLLTAILPSTNLGVHKIIRKQIGT